MTADFVAAVAAVVVVVAAPVRRNAPAVGADEREGRTRPVGAVALGLVGPVSTVIVTVARHVYRDAARVSARKLGRGRAFVAGRDTNLAIVAELRADRVGTRALNAPAGRREADVRAAAVVIVTGVCACIGQQHRRQ